MKSEKFKDSLGNTWKVTEYYKSDFKELLDYNEKFPKLFDKIRSDEKVNETVNCSNGEEAILATSDYILFFYYVLNHCYDEARDLLENYHNE